ncbi:hypothetical protein FDP41_003868 [Naegleria fowleri]|uniref:Tyrosine specific protein phosphatases domain-containing protein n=1 Tax=Naegleria fowleri TaxID=5763 RepID=A0A6A5BV50_NAEFO|nr:uncharacterized protein FDP41_003868 [Naegleria fowleri]KAF0977215.1 hypothetical protein FDP41_003868 [Naegleria fowleri]CAG4713365.1 unnamed protein product [Naegleria fowleri]
MRRSPSITVSLSTSPGNSGVLSSSLGKHHHLSSNDNKPITSSLSTTPSDSEIFLMINNEQARTANSNPTNNTTTSNDINGSNNGHSSYQQSFIQLSNQLHPPFRFRCIAPQIFVGAYPTLRNLRYLKRLKLKTILSLIPEKPITDLREFCDYEKIMIYHFQTPKYKEQVSLSFSEVSTIIEMFLNSKYHPIYCHCLDGTQVSSVLVMCFRKLQNWSKTAMKNELSRYTSELSDEDFDFVKQWKGPVKIDKRYIPDWIKSSSAIAQLLVTHEKKKKKQPKSIQSQEDSEDNQYVLKHVSGIKIIVEGYEENNPSIVDSASSQSPSHTTISVSSKGFKNTKRIGTPTIDLTKIKPKTTKGREHTKSTESLSPNEDLDQFKDEKFPSFVETQSTAKKEKPSLCIRGLDLGYLSEKQRQQMIIWKNKKITFRDILLPPDVEEFLDDMEDPFIHDEYLSFLAMDSANSSNK